MELIWPTKHESLLLHVMLGILNLLAGLLMIVKPDVGAVSLTLVLSCFFIVSGLFKAISIFFTNLPNKFWIFLNGIISTILGIIVIYQWPLSAYWVIGLFVGIDMIFSGWSSVMLSLMAKKEVCIAKEDSNL